MKTKHSLKLASTLVVVSILATVSLTLPSCESSGWFGEDAEQVAQLEATVDNLRSALNKAKVDAALAADATGKPDAEIQARIDSLQAQVEALQAIIDRAKNPDGSLNLASTAAGIGALFGPEGAALGGLAGTAIMSIMTWVKSRQKTAALTTIAKAFDTHSINAADKGASNDALYRDIKASLPPADAATFDAASVTPFATPAPS